MVGWPHLLPNTLERSWQIFKRQPAWTVCAVTPLSNTTPVPSNLRWLITAFTMANSVDISVNLTHTFHCNNLWCPAISAPIWHCWSRAKFPIVVTEDLNALTVGSCDDDSGADSWLILVWICACRCLHSSCDLWRYLSLTSGANTFQLRLIKAILSRLVNAALLCWGYWRLWGINRSKLLQLSLFGPSNSRRRHGKKASGVSVKQKRLDLNT